MKTIKKNIINVKCQRLCLKEEAKPEQDSVPLKLFN